MRLTTNYMGLQLDSPLIVGASPFADDIDACVELEAHGAGALVMHSLFEEQITLQSIDLDRFLSFGTESFAESLSYFPDMTYYNLGPDGYLEHIRKCKRPLTFRSSRA